jgi:hypothetical protein
LCLFQPTFQPVGTSNKPECPKLRGVVEREHMRKRCDLPMKQAAVSLALHCVSIRLLVESCCMLAVGNPLISLDLLDLGLPVSPGARFLLHSAATLAPGWPRPPLFLSKNRISFLLFVDVAAGCPRGSACHDPCGGAWSPGSAPSKGQHTIAPILA